MYCAIINLHDYLMYFLINVFVIVVVFFVIAIFYQQSYLRQQIESNLLTKEVDEMKISINSWANKMDFIKMYNKYRLQKFNHAPLLEFFWTIIPTIMLILMGWPSFKVLYAMEQLIDPIHTVIVIGNQWYRTYSYSDFDVVSDFIKQLDSNNFLNSYIYSLLEFKKRDLPENFIFKPIKLDVSKFDLSNFVAEKQKLILRDIDRPRELVSFFFKKRDLPENLIFTPIKFDLSNFVAEKQNIIFKKISKSYLIDFKSIIHGYRNIFAFDFNDFNKKSETSKIINKKNLIQSLSKYLRKFEESKLIYDCVILSDENLPVGYPRLLSTDQVLVLPAYVSIRILVTSVDVIHSWALPSHGIKMDAIPGRINQISFLTQTVGTYWGQCSELCGINHGFMPIEVRVLLLNDYLSYISLNISYRQDKLIYVAEQFIKLYIVRQFEKFEKSFLFEISENFLY